MLDWLTEHAELIAGGIVGLSMLGVIARNALTGWAEARAKVRDTSSSIGAFSTAVSLSWDRDQIERALQALESIAESMEISARASEAIAKAQGILSDNFQQSTQSKLDELLHKLDDIPAPKKR